MASYCCLSLFEISYYHNHVLFLEMSGWPLYIKSIIKIGSAFRCSLSWLDNLGCTWSITAKQLMKFLSLIQQFPSPVFWKLLLTCCVCSKFRKEKNPKHHPLHFEATSFCLCLWYRLTVGVVWLWAG